MRTAELREAVPVRLTEPFDPPGNVLRMPPCNYEAERALLGAILINNRAYELVDEFLQPEHFMDPVNGRIFGSIRSQIEKGSPANPVSLKTFLERDDLVIAAGGMKYLAGLAASAVTIINAGEYGRLVYDLFLRRELIAAGEDLVNDAFDAQPGRPASDIIETAESHLHNLTNNEPQDWAADIETDYDDALKRWEAHDKGESTGLSTGIRDIDEAAGLMEGSDLQVWGARPGMCKTTTARVEAYHVARGFKAAAERDKTKPKWVMFFSAEMSRPQLMDCIITGLTGIPAPRQRRRRLTEAEWVQIIRLRDEIAGLPIRVIAKPAPTLSFIRGTCRRMKKRGGAGLIIADYLQILGLERDAGRENRTQEVSYLARGLKEIAKLFDCPVVALSQLSRKVEDRDDKKPRMSDLRESGEIEAAADVILLLYRPGYYIDLDKPVQSAHEDDGGYLAKLTKWEKKRDAAANILEVIVGKARYGESGKTVRLYVDLARGWVEDLAQREIPGL